MSSVDSPTAAKRVCFLMRARPETLDQYRLRHADVWPEMLAALRDAGWRNYSLFARADGLIVGYVETEDFDASLAAMQRADVNSRWQAEMAPFFELTGEGAPDQAFEHLEEIFHLA
jgi:L-rhamnose mutarotase